METMSGRSFVDEPPCIIQLSRVNDEAWEERFTAIEVSDDENNNGDSVARQDVEAEEQKSSVFDKLAYFFYQIAGEDERVDAFELQRVMAAIFRSHFPDDSEFSLEACRSMVASMDEHRYGKLDYPQFKAMWGNITTWKHTFEVSERSRDGKIDYTELCIGLRQLGFHLEDNTIEKVMNRFQNKHHVIELDDFIQICSKISSARESFERRIKYGDAELDAFLLEIIYN